MKLNFSHSGRQFFFITLVVAERREVLSRVVDERSRPELTRLGEIVQFALRAVHRVWPAATVSDFVIMPDHLHFLLIVNYGKDVTFSPLFVAHRLADAVEAVAERTGDAPESPKETRVDREIAAGRLAILSAAHDTAAISSLAMKRDPSAAHAFRRNCLEMNDIAKAICEAAM